MSEGQKEKTNIMEDLFDFYDMEADEMSRIEAPDLTGYDPEITNESFLDNNFNIEWDKHILTSPPCVPDKSPIPTNGTIVSDQPFLGERNFQFHIDPAICYSEKLKKVYLKMKENLIVKYQCSSINETDGLKVRAVVIFSKDQDKASPVTRCPHHISKDSNEELKTYFIRTADLNSEYESYHMHHSIVTRLCTPQVGESCIPVGYSFHCQNSCCGGIERRPITLLLQLEKNACVIGRHGISLKVCSAPKRDKENDEKKEIRTSIMKKRKLDLDDTKVPFEKLRKNGAADDDNVYAITMKIKGKQNCEKILDYAYNVMAGAGVKNGDIALYKPYLDGLSKTPI